MKHKLLFFSILSIASVGGYLSTTSALKSEEDDLIMANIEALSDDETGSSFQHGKGKPMTPFKCGGALATGTSCEFMVVMCEGGGEGCTERKCPQHG